MLGFPVLVEMKIANSKQDGSRAVRYSYNIQLRNCMIISSAQLKYCEVLMQYWIGFDQELRDMQRNTELEWRQKYSRSHEEGNF